MKALVAWRGKLLVTERKIRVLSVSSLFLTRVGVYVGVCRCIRTHTHTLHRWGTRMWAQESGWDTWRARRIQMDKISTCIYSYMCTKYKCVCICQEAGWDLGLTAFFSDIFFLPNKKSKRCELKTPIISNLKYKIWALRPSIKGTKPLFIVIKVIIIISSKLCKLIRLCTLGPRGSPHYQHFKSLKQRKETWWLLQQHDHCSTWPDHCSTWPEKIIAARDLIKCHSLAPELATELFTNKSMGAFRFSAALIERSESELNDVKRLCVQACKNAWHLPRSTASALFIFPKIHAGKESTLPMGALTRELLLHAERCMRHEDVQKSCWQD